MRNKLTELCDHEDKLVEHSQNPLAKLIRRMLYDREITPLKLMEVLKTGARESGNISRASQKAQGRRRSSYIVALSRDTVSWKMFNRGLQLFKIKGYTLYVKYEFADGTSFKDHITNGQSLALLWDRLQKRRGVNKSRLSLLVKEWYKRPENTHLITDSSGRPPLGNILRGLCSQSLTWNFYMDGLTYLDIPVVMFDLEVEWATGFVSTHGTTYSPKDQKFLDVGA